MLRNRQFLLLWFTNITTTLALELFSITVLVAVFEQTSSTLQAAGTMVARTLAAVVLGPIAGVLVDRFPRKYVLVTMDVVRLALVGSAVWFLQNRGELPVVAIYALLAGLSAAGTFHQPAKLALIPSLVPREQLARANSMILASNQIMLAVSYTVGGWLILAFPLGRITIGVVVLFALAIVAALLIVVPKRVETGRTGPQESFHKSLVSGWAYLRRHPVARPLAVMEAAEHVPHGIWTGALLLAFTAQALGGDASDWGYQVTGYFAGMIVGSLAALGIGERLGRFPGRIIVANAFAAGLMTLAFSTSQTVAVAVLWAFVFGPPNAIRDVAQDTLLQGTVEGGQLGRVYATRQMLCSVVFMVSGLGFAWLSDLVAIRWIYIAGGALYLLTGFYALSNKGLRESRIPTEPPLEVTLEDLVPDADTSESSEFRAVD
jgi:MFS family permease